MGHQRRFDVGGMSAIAPTATKTLRRDERRKGPQAVMAGKRWSATQRSIWPIPTGLTQQIRRPLPRLQRWFWRGLHLFAEGSL
jgi:hypothetical protein